MDGHVMAPMIRRGEDCREDIVVLIEVVRCLLPVGTVRHLVAVGLVVAVGILDKLSVLVRHEIFVQGVVFAQAVLVHVLVGADARARSPRSVHEAEVVVACRHSAPGLSRLLEVADVLVAHLELLVQPGQSAIVGSCAAGRAMYETIRCSLVVGSVKDEMIEEQACRELGSCMIRAEAAIAARQLQARLERGSRRGQCHRTTKGTVSMGRCADTSLDLYATHEGGIGVHVGPEDGLVLRRVERDAVQRDVDTTACGAADTHIRCAHARAVLTPCEDARCVGEEERQLLSGLGESFQVLLLDVAYCERRILRRADALYDHFLHRLCGERVNRACCLLCLRCCRAHQRSRG